MSSVLLENLQWTERPSASASALPEDQSMFKLFFERSADAIWLFDADAGVFVDSNQAAVELIGATRREQLVNTTPPQLAPPTQPDGRPSDLAAAELMAIIKTRGSTRFEWTARRFDGRDVPLEVLATTLLVDGRNLHVVVARDITERKQAEQKIRELNQTLERRIAERTVELTASEARLRTLLEHAPEAIVVFDGETGRFLSANAHAARLYRRDAGELPHLTPGDVSPEFQPNGRRSADLAREKMDEALQGGTPAFEWMHQQPDGQLVPTEVRLVRLPAEGQRLLCATIIDNTGRVRREQALRRRHEQMQRHRNVLLELAQADKSDFHQALLKICSLSATTLDVARVSYWSLQEQEAAIVCKTLFLRDRQRADESFPGTRLGATDSPAYFRALATRLPIIANEALSHPATSGLAESYLKPLGITSMLDAPVWVRGEVVGVLCHEHIGPAREWSAEEIDFASALAAMVSLAIEESNRARSEWLLRESEEKFRALFEASSQGVMLHDENQYLEVNPAIVRILGYDSPQELIGLHPAETSPPLQPGGEATPTLARKYIQECLAKGHVRFDWVARKKNGEDVPIEVILTRIQWSGKQIIQAAVNDISERKRAEAELLRTLEREKELNRLKSNFVSMVSHEFRTPLGIIQSSAEILKDYLEQLDAAERAAQLSSIISNTRRMGEMMEEILVLSRLDAGRMEFQPAAIDLRAFCRRVVDEVQSATDRRCAIELSFADVPGRAQGDERLLGHIFTNLLGNAVKYSEPGATVQFALEADGDDAVCLIRDRGIGIPEADQPWLFHAFQRGGNVGERPGTGLGLVIVKRCVELHGGKTKIKSLAGEGTEVTVRLPLFRSGRKKREGARGETQKPR